MDIATAVLFVAPEESARDADAHLASEGQLTVETAVGQDAGLERLKAGSFDCVVSEYELPDGDGVSFLQAVREEHPDLPFILFTDADGWERASEAIAADVTDLLPKAGDASYQFLAERIDDVVEHHRADRRAERIERISSVARQVNRTLVRTDTRQRLEQRVCDIITESEPYLFAWIGGVDPETGRIEPRSSGGLESGYLDEIVVTSDETATGRGPGGRTIRTREMAIVQDVQHNPEFEPWREQAIERGYQSVAGVPLLYDDTLYGALLVYADHPHAFDERERELLDEVASDIAYAINAIELRDAVARHAQLTEHAPVGIFTTDPAQSGTLLEVNPALADIFGAESVGELIGRPVSQFYANPEVRSAILEELREGGVVSRELQLKTLRGDEIWALVTLVMVEEEDGTKVIAGALQDVTQRKHLEQRLGEEHEFIETVLQTSPVAIVVLDTDGAIVRANEFAENVFGLEENEMTGRTYNAPEWNIFDVEGEPVPSEELPFARVMQTGTPVYDYEHGIERPDGTRVWLSINMVPITNANGEVTKAVGAVADVTELKRQEQALEERREQLAFFNHLLRHEILNGMTVILGLTDMMLETMPETSEHYPLVERIDSRGRDIVEFVQRVRRILQHLTLEEPLVGAKDVVSAVEDRAGQLRSDYPEADVTVDAPAEARVNADDLLSEVIYNVLTNAVQHSDREHPQVDIDVERDAETTTVRVADNGPGIPDDVKEVLFERGDWMSSRGTFGLYFVNTMMNRYGGSVEAEDNEPRGAVVVLTFTNADDSS